MGRCNKLVTSKFLSQFKNFQSQPPHHSLQIRLDKLLKKFLNEKNSPKAMMIMLKTMESFKRMRMGQRVKKLKYRKNLQTHFSVWLKICFQDFCHRCRLAILLPQQQGIWCLWRKIFNNVVGNHPTMLWAQNFFQSCSGEEMKEIIYQNLY